MNVWALEKDLPLKVLLIVWIQEFGNNQLCLNLAEQHFQAIEVMSVHEPNLRAYIYTFGQSPGLYGLDLKYPIATHNIIGENENQTLEQVIAILQTHLLF